MDQPKPNKQIQITAVWILILFQTALALAVTFDTLSWWAGKDIWSQLGLIFLILVCIAVLPIMVLPIIWESILKKSKDRPALPFQRIGAYTSLVLDVLATGFLILAFFFGLRTVHSGDSRLIGYLIPGGHARAVLAIASPSLEHSFDGTLSVSATDSSGAAISSRDYRVSNNKGHVLSGRTLTQYDPLIIRRTISIPPWTAGDLTLSWSSTGQTKVLEGSNGYRVLQASGGAAYGPAYFNEVLSEASGSFSIPSNLYPPLLQQLVVFKEGSTFFIYLGAFLLLNLSYLSLVRTKGIPEMTAAPPQASPKPQVNPEQAAPGPKTANI